MRVNIKPIIEKIEKTESRYVENKIFSERGKIYSFLNPYGYHILRKQMELYLAMDGLFVDGILMCILTRLLYGIKIKRRSFDSTSVAKDFFNRANVTGETIYLVGAAQNEIESTVKQINISYPKINIVGYRNGFFSNEEDRKECFNSILKKNPDFVIVGMGAVLQERFVLDLKQEGYKGICFTCGGYLRQAANGVNYYPNWINRFHLRAFYRLYKEKGLFGRLKDVFIGFPILFLHDRFFQSK